MPCRHHRPRPAAARTDDALSGAHRIDLPGAELHLHPAPDWPAPPDTLLELLVAQTRWAQRSIRMFGRALPEPRLTAWHGDPQARYRYAGLTLEPVPWTPLLAELRDRAAALAGSRFNSVLLNLYRDGADGMGMHSDDEKELGPAPVIASLSLGAERTIAFAHRTDRSVPKLRIALGTGSLLVMSGQTQARFRHGIARQRAACGMRLNLTFRCILHAG